MEIYFTSLIFSALLFFSTACSPGRANCANYLFLLKTGDFLQHWSGFLKKTTSNFQHWSGFLKKPQGTMRTFPFFFISELATVLKVHQETKQHMRRLVQGVLAFLSVAMSLAVWNNKDRASKQLVRSCDKQAQENLVMSLYGKPEI
jgi:hypothetical protein